MNRQDFDSQYAALAPSTHIVSRTRVTDRHTDRLCCVQGTADDLRVGAGRRADAPVRAPDLQYNFVSLDGNYCETREVWITRRGQEATIMNNERIIIQTREANTARDGWPTAAWLLGLSRHVEVVAYAMDQDDPMRRRVQTIAGVLRNGAEAREVYPAGVSRPVDIERERALDDATSASDAIILMLPKIHHDAARVAEYRASRGAESPGAAGSHGGEGPREEVLPTT